MSDVPPRSGWQPPAGDQPSPGGAEQPPAGPGWQQQPPEPPPSWGYDPPAYQAQQTSPAGQLAPWWKRLLAIIIDALLIGVPLVIFFFVVVGVSLTQSLERDPVTGETTTNGGLFTGSSLLFQLVALIVTVAYYGLLNGGEKGQTVGKTALGIRVRDAVSDQPIGLQRAAVRYLVDGLTGLVPVLALFALVDGLWPLWDPQRQALHDKLAGSVVLKAA